MLVSRRVRCPNLTFPQGLILHLLRVHLEVKCAQSLEVRDLRIDGSSILFLPKATKNESPMYLNPNQDNTASNSRACVFPFVCRGVLSVLQECHNSEGAELRTDHAGRKDHSTL